MSLRTKYSSSATKRNWFCIGLRLHRSHSKHLFRFLLFLTFLIQLALSSAPTQNENLMENKNFQKATFAGGCFWCMQPVFDKMKGVVSSSVGYAGGTKENPTYEEVSSGRTGHTEA